LKCQRKCCWPHTQPAVPGDSDEMGPAAAMQETVSEKVIPHIHMPDRSVSMGPPDIGDRNEH